MTEMPDKQVYFARLWNPATFISQQGLVITAKMLSGVIVHLPYTHVRDARPACKGCDSWIFGHSYQTQEGTSFCPTCYQELDLVSIDLYFGGHQWLSWDGQISVRGMDSVHIANTLGMIKRNAEDAAELAGGKIEEYLSPSFQILVQELHSRRPAEEQIKINSFMLYIWSVLYMMFGKSTKQPKLSNHPKATV